MCPAWGQVCSKCNKRNHFSRCCPPDVRSKVHVIDEQSSHVEYEVHEYSVLTVYTDESIRHVSTGPLYTEMMLPNKTAADRLWGNCECHISKTCRYQQCDEFLALSLTCTTTPRWSLWASAYIYSKTLLMGTNTAWNFKLSRRTSSLYSAGEQPKECDS